MRARFPLVLWFLAACGGGDGGPSGLPGGNNNNPGTPPPTSASISMRTEVDAYGYAGASSFDPSSTRIARGGTVTWSNSSSATHNVTFNTTGAPSNVPDMPSGTASRTFNTTGTFAYHCSNHTGMNGTIVVE